MMVYRCHISMCYIDIERGCRYFRRVITFFGGGGAGVITFGFIQ